MRLLDQVAQSRRRKFMNGTDPIPDAFGLREALYDCHARYVLDPEAAAFARSLVLDQADLLSASIGIVRVPDRTIWVEWVEPAAPDSDEFRIGMLVETEADGRSGTIGVAFDQPGVEPSVSPAGFVFDFDAPGTRVARDTSFTMSHATLALGPLFECVEGRIHPAWAAHWRSDPDPAKFEREKANLARGLWMAPALLFAFCLILGASAQFERREVEYDALNRRRRKRGKVPLLNHSEMVLKLFGPVASVDEAGASEGSRRTRLHHVRGHFVRRQNAIFWRRAHLRGDPSIAMPALGATRIALG